MRQDLVTFLTDGLNPSVAPVGRVHVYTPYELMGVKVMAAAGVLSCVFVSILLLYITYSAFMAWYWKKGDVSAEFTSKQIAVFITCLLVSDLIQSISGVTQVKWASEKKIYDGRSCTIQAVTLVMGDLGSTFWSCVIAAHTFSGIALGKHWPRWLVIATVVVGWAFVILLTFIPPIRIQNKDTGPGTIGGNRIEGQNSLISNANEVLHRQRINIAKRMLWYPIAYLACIFPIAIVRLVGLKDEEIPDAIWIFSMFFLFSLGAVDSIIYATTRKMIKPINLPFHMVSLSHGSGSNGQRVVEEGISLEKRTSHIHRSSHNNIKMTWPGDDLEDIDIDFRKDGFESSPSTRLGGIQITLERIQEVM
ncbi:hypothetical protein Clacol_009078 [Clathrus columnatus]|uniref:Uncharacterized protein n=1 Tax=Clathrus columnatus TaxID=1419009 RepID=A0AAV5APQ8_9AGAM|nr:hypothetical protein Clacol_009078 [Clathrus columnatus]